MARLYLSFTIILLAIGLAASRAEISEPVDFNFHIRPILSDRCYKCHGPDEQSRKAKLRLDTEEGSRAWMNKEQTLRAITPGKPRKSSVFHRITSNDPDELMPPPDSNLKLDKNEIALLQKWIEQGAKYKPHWSFLPVQKPRPPKIKTTWAQNPIDPFVLARLQRERLQPTTEATRETLIRRLSFDLTGLPPTTKELDNFLNDSSSQAYEKLVNRLLASSAYGERMANEWLDLARYADTYGYQSDVDMEMSPWRDWVIRAFNKNMPYDQFILWQIAGDLLSDATDEQILATAFNRLHRQTNEGGSIDEEFRVEYVADRVHTFGTTFLGLTLDCARCHDHKYDPITQRDYYRMFAFFDNIDESGIYSHFTKAIPSPTLLLYKERQKSEHAELKKRIAAKENEMERVTQLAKTDFAKWRDQNSCAHFEFSPAAHFSFESVSENKTPDITQAFFGSLSENPKQVPGRSGNAIQFDGESSVTFKNLASFKRTDPFSFSLWLKPTEQQERAVILHHSRAWTDSGSRGYELILEQGKPHFSLIHFWPGNAISIRAKSALPQNEWTHLVLTSDGSSRASGLRIFINGKPVDAEIVKDNLFKDILHRAEWGDADANNIDLKLGARFRDSGFKNGALDEFTVFNRCLTPLEVRWLAAGFNNSNQLSSLAPDEDLFTFYLHRIRPDYTNALAELSKLRSEENEFVKNIREIMVMREMPERRPTFLLARGAYDSPADPVQPGVPERVFPLPNNLPGNRLGLAQWLVDRRNPLTARVAVNRAWKLHFGRGLVATPEDFGSQGRLPSHPELLDWLAADFMENGWDLKRLHKQIVMSATYRQSSQTSTEIAADPENILLARGPKHRLPAEQIRDAALTASGLLTEKIGGPSVKPYQPAGLWEQSGLSKTYAQDSGDKLYRRSLYTFWRRTSPPPSMTTFDATSREVCTAKREITATPLQSLLLMNDPQFIEAARVMAEQLIQRHNQLSPRIDEAFRAVLGRKPHKRELEIVERLFTEQFEIFSRETEAAEKIVQIGERKREQSLPTSQLAAMTMVVTTLMNHDEFVMKK